MKRKLFKMLGFFLALLLGLATFQGCQKDEDVTGAKVQRTYIQDQAFDDAAFRHVAPNTYNGDKISFPAVELKNYPKPAARITMRSGCNEAIDPPVFNKEVKPGEIFSESIIACLGGMPTRGDVLFTFDLSRSMGESMDNIFVTSVNMMNYIRSNFAEYDVRFGVISHTDYDGYFDGCSYGDNYGTNADYPYKLIQSFTPTPEEVLANLQSLSIGDGGDAPESYSRVFYEAYSDPTIDWMPGAAKVIVAWLDAPPHDCNWDTGGDPGRDGVMGTDDDLYFDNVIENLVNHKIKLVVMCVGDPKLAETWRERAEKTGGTAYYVEKGGINPETQLPTGIIQESMEVEKFICELINANSPLIGTLRLDPDPALAAWFKGCSPACYNNILMNEDKKFLFDEVTFGVPAGTPSGNYKFLLNLNGDEVTYGQQYVVVSVKSDFEVPVDIQPMQCPNVLSNYSKGVFDVSICGIPDFMGYFDVKNIDIQSVRLAGVAPVFYAYGDDATPYVPFVNKALNQNSCNNFGPDGITDLRMKFNAQSIIKAIGPVEPGMVIRIVLTGKLQDGTSIIGEDIVRIK